MLGIKGDSVRPENLGNKIFLAHNAKSIRRLRERQRTADSRQKNKGVLAGQQHYYAVT